MPKKEIKKKVPVLDKDGIPTGAEIDKVIGHYYDDPIPFPIYTYLEFLQRLISDGVSGDIYGNKKSSGSEFFMEYARAVGIVNFNDPEIVAMFNAAFVPGIYKKAGGDAVTGA